MKLLRYTTGNFLWSVLLIMVLTGSALYIVLRTMVEHEMMEQLNLQAQMVADEMHQGNPVHYPLVEVRKVKKPGSMVKRSGDTLICDYTRGWYEDYRFLEVYRTAGNDTYLVKVMVTYIGWDKYYKTIFKFFACAVLLACIAGMLLNSILSRKLWKPFFFNLRQLNSFSVSRQDEVLFESSAITEFKELKEVLESLTARSRQEYISLREFTENASHEMQTPLGIIQSKLDRLSQHTADEVTAGIIVQAKAAVERLRRVNKSLLLLARLDNNTYYDKEELQLEEVICRQMEQMEDLYTGKNLTVTLVLQPLTVIANRYLTEVMVSNLFANALHYTPESGAFEVLIKNGAVICSNTGPALSFPAEQLFDRFKKGEQNSQSTGLGLAIVKQIAVLNQWVVRYTYEAGFHIFTVELFV